MEKNINNCNIVAKCKKSKGGNEYYAVFLIVDDTEIFLNYISKKTFDEINEK